MITKRSVLLPHLDLVLDTGRLLAESAWMGTTATRWPRNEALKIGTRSQASVYYHFMVRGTFQITRIKVVSSQWPSDHNGKSEHSNRSWELC